MKIILDAMGGDFAPEAPVMGKMHIVFSTQCKEAIVFVKLGNIIQEVIPAGSCCRYNIRIQVNDIFHKLRKRAIYS